MPVTEIVEHSHHHRVGDYDTRRILARREKTEGMPRFHHECLLVGKFLEIFFYQTVLQPVLAHLSCLSVRHKFVRIKSDIETEVIVYHNLKCFSCKTIPLVLVDGLGLEIAGRTPAIAVNTASGAQFLKKFGRRLFMEFLGKEGILQSRHCLLGRQCVTAVGGSPYAFLELRHFRPHRI